MSEFFPSRPLLKCGIDDNFPSPLSAWAELELPERVVQATLSSVRMLSRLSCWMFLTVRQSQGQEFSPTLSRASLGREVSDHTG